MKKPSKKQRDDAMTKIISAAFDLGWSVLFPYLGPNEKDFHGLIVGTEKYVDSMVKLQDKKPRVIRVRRGK